MLLVTRKGKYKSYPFLAKERDLSPPNWKAFLLFLFKTGSLRTALHTRTFSRVVIEELSMSQDNNVLPDQVSPQHCRKDC